MKAISLRQALKMLGYAIVKFKYGYNNRYGFMVDSNGELYYFSYQDLRDDRPTLLVRTAESLEDYRGGRNTYPSLGNYYIKEERKQRYDYNKN